MPFNLDALDSGERAGSQQINSRKQRSADVPLKQVKVVVSTANGDQWMDRAVDNDRCHIGFNQQTSEKCHPKTAAPAKAAVPANLAAPAKRPSRDPSSNPSGFMSGDPSSILSGNPSGNPSSIRIGNPSGDPSIILSGIPCQDHSSNPSGNPSSIPVATRVEILPAS